MGIKDWITDWRIGRLISRLGDINEERQAEAISKLAEMGETAVPALIKALKEAVAEDQPFSTKMFEALEMLAMIGEPAVEPVIGILEDGNKEVRWAAVNILGGIKDVRAVDPLIKRLTDSHMETRKRAAWALGEIGDSRATPALIEAFRDGHPEVINNAAEALVKIIPNSEIRLADFRLLLQKFVDKVRKEGDRQKLWRIKIELAATYRYVAEAVAKKKQAGMGEILPVKIKPPKPGKKRIYRELRRIANG